MANPERVVLVDGSNLMYRAFFALPSSLMTSSGQPTNAIFGFATMFRKLFSGKTPTFGAITFDAPGPTFRDAQFADYKATRAAMPDDLRAQQGGILEVCEAHGFPILRVPGVEADDVIGTLARQAREAGHDVIIVSSDKDFGQLIDDQVRMLDTMRDVTFDAELVRKKWGVRPEQMIDYLALVGDKADNVPGCPGIGDKSAVELLAAYGDLDSVYAHLDELKGRQKNALEKGRELAELSRQLVTIDQHVALERSIDQLRVVPPEASVLNALYVALEFYSLISDADRDALSEREGDTHYARVGTHDALAALLARLNDRAAPVAVVPVFAEEPPAITPLAGLAVATEPGRAWYVAFEGRGEVIGGRGFATLARWLNDPARPKVCHDAKELWRGLTRQGVALEGVVFDTRLASFLVEPTRIIPHRLDQLSKEFLHRTIRPAKSVIGSGKSQVAFLESDPDDLTEWACHLADAVVSIYPAVQQRLREEGQEAQLLERDLPLSWVLGRMEVDGILVDVPDLEAMGVEFRERLAELERRTWELAGREFNLGSTKQLGEMLFDELGLPVVKRTKTGYSTDSDVLEKLAESHAIAAVVLEWRKLAKLINTYTDVLTRSVHPETGRIHATFQQTTGATGRLISTDPDLQRTPIHTAEGKRIRHAFIAPAEHRIISADWSQIELRLLAHVSGDPELIEAFREGHDVHRRTASKLFDVPLAEVSPEQRGVGKTVNFATIYGQGATALAQLLKIPRADAKRYIDQYFNVYAGVRGWLDRTTAEALERGYVTTMNGRRRYIPELSSNNPMDRQAGIRIAANTPIQGSAADLCKAAMMDIARRLEKQGLATKMLLQIHDELVFEAPDHEVEVVTALVRDAMERALELAVPLVVDIGVGQSWGEAH
ncbi:MAG: DNA polymerase I [Deltaproteobacteria bacterium HGW-Deltaproteobacteria-14]|jgi:DNA polymerase-1|nr:MAG: DNA polymerase I [Deltaproteobacteria bacterium HGW-Deltaproteobacteria-14]